MSKHATDRSRRATGVAAAVAALTLGGGGLVAYGLSQQETRDPAWVASSGGSHEGHGMSSSAAEPSGSSTSGSSSGSAGSADPHAGHMGMGGSSSSGSSSPTASQKPAARYVRPSGETLARSQPTKVRIPSLDVSSTIGELGLQQDKRMEVPQDGTSTGWYTGSPTPGELGPSVLAAHVTWDKKPAVFFDLGAMKKGQKIEVDRKDGTTAIFSVEDVGQYPKSDFPTDDVYGTVDHAALRLITCGGFFDGETGHHVDNVVVYAKLVGSR
ncbi:class F sortase [Janibacter melonis]|uniref:Class F sortase n=2 Tax=Janibacter melonis TaxID=262209 RepID=A0A5P8FJE0_9MICO|nr:class F sortase [Janibacter melonis]QFQ29627.2 class F sortase [Janibacter melonis]